MHPLHERDQVRALWKLGDPWRDLQPEIVGAVELIAAVSEHGSIRLLDVANQVQIRMPGPHRGALPNDLYGVDLASVAVATPCGIVTWGRGRTSWGATTRLRALLAGPLVEITAAIDLPQLPESQWAVGHPDGTCGAAYCVNRVGSWSPPDLQSGEYR